MAFVLMANVASAQMQVIFSGDPDAPVGSTVDVDVSVADFNQIVLYQYSINWDSTVMKFVSVSNVTSVLPQFTELGNIGNPSAPALEEGEMTVSWSLQSTEPVTIPDNTILFTATFEMVGEPCEATTLEATGDPLDIEVIDENFNEIGIISSPIQIEVECDGGTNPTPCAAQGDMSGVGIIAPETVEQSGTSVCVPITVDNFVDIQSAQGGFEWDPAVLSYTGTQNIVLPGAVLNEMNTGAGNIVYTWFDGTGVTPVTLNDGDVLMELCFDVIGSNGSFSFIFTENSSVNNEFGDSNGNPLPDYTDCGSITIGDPVMPGANFTLIASDETVGPAGQACVTISAANFIDIASMQFTLNWNSSVLEYTSCNVTNFNSTLGIGCGNFNFFPTDKLRLTWNSINGDGFTFVDPVTMIPDTVALFDVCYDVVGNCDDSTPINFIDDVGVPIEIGDGDANEVTPVDLIPGSVSIVCQLNISGDVTDPECNGGLGQIDITLSGQQGTTTCVWKDENGNVISSGSCNLTAAAGCYTLCVTDDLGTNTFEACIEEPDPIMVSTMKQDVTCTELGQIVVTASGGDGSPLTCSIAPFGNESPECTFIDLPAGNYTITVTDGTCSETAQVTILNTGSINVDEDISNVSCDNLGSIELTVTGNGGVTPTYNWSPSSLSGCCNSGLEAGTYEVTVSVGNCEVLEEYIITSSVTEMSVQATVENISCEGACDGAIQFAVSGGCAPYTFSPPLSSLMDLCPGSYTVNISDSSPDPQTFSDIFNITEPDELVATVDMIVGSCGDTGEILLSVSGGTEPYNYVWDCPVAPDCPGNVQDPTGLAVGIHSVTITDDNMCEVVIMDIDVPNACPDMFVVSGVNVSSEDLFNGFGVSCAGSCDGEVDGQITDPQGPVSIVVTDQDGNSSSTDALPITGLCAGNYDITFSDGTTDTTFSNIVISEPSMVAISLVDTTCTIQGEMLGAVDIEVAGGVGGYMYDWNFGQMTEDIDSVAVGTYFVTVTDANGCEDTAMYIVASCGPPVVGEDCYQGISVITPNGDGFNDLFLINCATDNPNSLMVFDRWGRDVYTQENYDNSWNGTDDNGNELIEGAYYWVMQVDFANGDSRIFKGAFTVLRGQ